MLSTNSITIKAVVLYMPALHRGYVSFLTAHDTEPIFILGKSFIDAYPRLNRDLRALEPQEVALALQALGFSASVIEQSDIERLNAYQTLFLPNEDVSRDFGEKYAADKELIFETIFLRWDGIFSNTENIVSPDRTISRELFDRECMHVAVEEGKLGADWWRQIGAVIVKDTKVIYKTHILYFPSDLALDIFGTPRTTVDFGERPDLYISMHAEAGCIAQAARKGISLEGSSLYSSTFPCINCAFLIARSGVARVYYQEGYSRIDAESVLTQADVEIIYVEPLKTDSQNR